MVELFPELAPLTRTVDIGVSRAEVSVRDAQNAGRAMMAAAEQRGQLADALTALGKADAARTALEGADREIAEANSAPIPALREGEKEGGNFTGERSSASVVEELALLRAADLARDAGKTGGRRDGSPRYERTETTYYYGAALRTDPTGYTTQLDLELVDRVALLPRFRPFHGEFCRLTKLSTSLNPPNFSPATAAP